MNVASVQRTSAISVHWPRTIPVICLSEEWSSWVARAAMKYGDRPVAFVGSDEERPLRDGQQAFGARAGCEHLNKFRLARIAGQPVNRYKITTLRPEKEKRVIELVADLRPFDLAPFRVRAAVVLHPGLSYNERLSVRGWPGKS